MNTVTYFDIRNKPFELAPSGIVLTIDKLVSKCWLHDFHIAKTIGALKPNEISSSIQKLNNIDKKSWVRIVRTLVLSISGKGISLVDAYMYRDLYLILKKNHNFDYNSAPILLSYSYLICGFDIKKNNWSESGVNSYSDFISTIREIYAQKGNFNIISFMCPHREADNINKDTIVDSVKVESFLRIIKIIKGCFYNMGITKIDWLIYHISGDKSEMSSLFPNIIKNYLEKYSVDILISKLKNNYRQISEIAQENSDEKLTIQIIPLSKYVKKVKKHCITKYGDRWSTLINFTSICDPLITLACNLTSKDVSRYMPEYENDNFIMALKAYSSNPNIDYLMNVDNYSMHGKALFETVFYYLWGKMVKSRGGIGIGIDRDHDLFQTQAFNLGYNNLLDYSNGAGLLYMRRSAREIGSNSLKSISLRQFWRYSDSKR